MSDTAIAEAVATSEAKQAAEKTEQDKRAEASFDAAAPGLSTTKPATEPTKKLTVAQQKAAAAPAKTPEPKAAKTPAAKSTTAGKAEPQFAKLVGKLSQADSQTVIAGAEASQARAERSNIAVTTLRAAYGERLSTDDVRKALNEAGVLKGTVSKITTVLSGLYAKSIKVSDIKSLSDAYKIVKEIEKQEKANAPVAGGTKDSATEVFAVAPEPIVATTPKQALEVIFNSLRSVTDGDEMFRLAGDYLAQLSNGIDAIVKERDAAKE